MTATRAPRIHPQAIDLLSRHFNTHKKGLPEWLKNGREGYLRLAVASRDDRNIIINYVPHGTSNDTRLECIDFAGVSGHDIEQYYMYWADPDAARRGTKAGDVEGGQGNGGKGYLRQMFAQGYFISIFDGKLSVVSFVDKEKHSLDFVPNAAAGKDSVGDSVSLPGIRKYAESWLDAFGLPKTHNITIVRGMGPTRAVEPDALFQDIQQFPQARETIRSCRVYFYQSGRSKRELLLIEPSAHPAFPKPIEVDIPSLIRWKGIDVPTAQPPRFPSGHLVLRVSAKPLRGQALETWNRIDFRAAGITTIGYRPLDELPVQFPQYRQFLFGECNVPLLTDPSDNYEMQGRGRLNDGPLSGALYQFVTEEADKILGQIAKQEANLAATKKNKNLAKLNERLSKWIESKLTDLRGLAESGPEPGPGRRDSPRKRPIKPGAPAVTLQIHRQSLDICKGVTYQLRAVAYDAEKMPTSPGKITWRSQNPAVVSIHPERGEIRAEAPGLATVAVSNDAGLAGDPITIQVYEVTAIEVKGPNPTTVGSGRRLPLAVTVKTAKGRPVKDAIVAWRSSDTQVVRVTQDGVLVGGEVGEAEVTASVESVHADMLEVVVEKGSAGKPKGSGKGQPQFLLSGQHPDPWDGSPVLLDPTDPPVYQRPHKDDQDCNIFWINLQHPLAEALLRQGENSVQWRTYHFQRLVDAYTMIQMRERFGESMDLDVDNVLSEIQVVAADIYAKAKEELFDVLYRETIDFDKLGAV